MRRVAFLTSGGDCQALNATMRGVQKHCIMQTRTHRLSVSLRGIRV